MRVVGWQAALAQVVEGARSMAFEWGANDCCQFVARAAGAILGEDRRALFPSYSTQQEAAAIIEMHGGLAGLLTHAFGDPVHPSQATIGDIVLIDMGAGEQPAVCMGLRSFAPGRVGLEYRPTLMAVAAWKI